MTKLVRWLLATLALCAAVPAAYALPHECYRLNVSLRSAREVPLRLPAHQPADEEHGAELRGLPGCVASRIGDAPIRKSAPGNPAGLR